MKEEKAYHRAPVNKQKQQHEAKYKQQHEAKYKQQHEAKKASKDRSGYRGLKPVTDKIFILEAIWKTRKKKIHL